MENKNLILENLKRSKLYLNLEMKLFLSGLKEEKKSSLKNEYIRELLGIFNHSEEVETLIETLEKGGVIKASQSLKERLSSAPGCYFEPEKQYGLKARYEWINRI